MEKVIKIIDTSYNTVLLVPDGGSISVDGKTYQLEYLDETHFRAVKGGRCWHIHEFAHALERNGQKAEAA